MKVNNRVILAKIETVYGTDSVPTGAANAIWTRSISPTPHVLSTDDNTQIRPFFGQFEHAVGAVYATYEFEVPISLSAAAGTAPPWGPLLRACAHSENIVASTSVTYHPITTAEESATIYFHDDGNRFVMTGAKGTATFTFTEQKIPVIKFMMTGLVAAGGGITTVANPASTFTPWTRAIMTNQVNTTFTVGGYAAPLQSLVLDVNNTTPYINRPNRQAVDFTDRKSKLTLNIEQPTLAQYDIWTAFRAGTQVAISFTNGTVAGNRFKLNSSGFQMEQPSSSDQDLVTMLSIPGKLIPTTAGGDEYTILLD